MNYTKGEWKAYLVEKPNKWMVCSGKDGIDGIAKMVDSNQEANANLIAAAPDMYEALRLTRDNLQTLSDAAIHYKTTFSTNLEILNQTLSKAEGK